MTIFDIEQEGGWPTSFPQQVDVDIHVYFHFVGPIALLQLGPARKMILKIEGSTLPATLNVDQTGTVELKFVDDKGNETPVPAGATINFVSDNESVATVVVPDPSAPNKGVLTPTGTPGDCNVSADTPGAMEPDGTTPIPAPDPVAVHVDPGAPVGEQFTVTGPAQ